MKTTIDKAGRVVIPAAVRERAGLTPGSELEIIEDELGIRLERIAAGPRLVRSANAWWHDRRRVPAPGRTSTSPRSSTRNGIAGRERIPRHERAACGPGGFRPPERSGPVADACRR